MRYGFVVWLSYLLAACGDGSAGPADDDAVSPKCASAETRCSGSILQTCDGTAWRDTQDCASAGGGCTTDAAGASCTIDDSNDCTEGTTRCVSDVVETCSQGGWELTQNCASTGRVCTMTASSASCTEESEPPECTSEGALRCNGDLVQGCESGSWIDVEDCTESGESCDENTLTETASCVAPPAQYTYEGFTPGSNATALFYDNDLFGYHTLLSYDSANTPNLQISVENYPGWPGSIAAGQSGTQSLTGDNAAYATCGTCVIGGRGMGSSAKYFIGTEGSVTAMWPTTGGGAGNVALTNVKMQQINPQNAAVISGGETWFIAAATLSAPGSSRYPCMFWRDQELAAGDAVCTGISAAVVCDETHQVLMLDNTCSEAIQKCKQDTATTTSCASLPCQDPALNTGDGDFRLDSGESMCWSETKIVHCDSGNVALAQDCGTTSQVCAMADTGLAAACEAP